MQSYSEHRLIGTKFMSVEEKLQNNGSFDYFTKLNYDLMYQLLYQAEVIWHTQRLTSSNFLSSSHRGPSARAAVRHEKPSCTRQIPCLRYRQVHKHTQRERDRGFGLILTRFWLHGELALRSVHVQRARRVHLCPRHSSHLHAQVFRMRQTEQHHSHSHRRPGCANGRNGKCTKVQYKCVFVGRDSCCTMTIPPLNKSTVLVT